MSDKEKSTADRAIGVDGKDDGTDPIIGKAVGTRLKSLYTEFATEDVPDRFMDLIGKLEAKEQADKDEDSSTSGG